MTGASLEPEPALGVAGIVVMPHRDTPDAIHYLMTMARVKRELIKYLGAAREEAAVRVTALEGQATPAAAFARQELTFLHHSRGPMFQADILIALKYEEIEAAIYPGQPALERVREIAAGIAVGINRHPPELIIWAAGSLHKLVSAEDAPPTPDQLALLFLRNTASTNRADPRFAEAQRHVDEAIAAASEASAHDAERITSATEIARHAAAETIRMGGVAQQKGAAKPVQKPAAKEAKRA